MRLFKKFSSLFIFILLASCTVYVERTSSSNVAISSISESSNIKSSDVISSSIISSDVISSSEESSSSQTSINLIDFDGLYTSKEDVSLYLYTYHQLPKNYITKDEAKALGWKSGKIPGWTSQNKLSIGGDVFHNYEQFLPLNKSYWECDIDYNGKDRGQKRIVWSNTFEIYYTSNHYRSFVRLY